MLKVYTCIVQEHDLRLVVLAALVCTLASFTAIGLLHHVRHSIGRMQRIWLGVVATSSGFGIWATHFIAMLAFSPGIPSGYNIALTALSLVAAIILTGFGFAVALSRTVPAANWVGGALVGGGIAVMHYTGMAAFEIQGRIIWDPLLVFVSIAAGGLIGAAATRVGLMNGHGKWKLYGALLLTAAICSHHFTAMGAATIIPDPRIVVPETAMPIGWLAIAVAAASFGILMLACTGLALDIRDRRRMEQAADHMRGLANAAVEGLLLCDGETIVTANESFAELSGLDTEDIVGTSLSSILPPEAVRSLLAHAKDDDSGLTEAALRGRGDPIPVELVARSVTFTGRSHHAIAVRDLRTRKKAEADLKHLADHDALTGLPNRRSFNRRLDQEIAASTEGRYLALLCLDLDRFKEVNDLFGHAAGDALLKTVARCITTVLDDNQMVARIGGDEFTIIAPGLSDPLFAGRIAENIMEAFRIENENSHANSLALGSIGIAIYPNDALDRDALMSHADTALYRAKAEGRGTYRFFEAAMGEEIKTRRYLEHDMRHAIAKGEFHLVYQPQRIIATEEIIGFEALIRWHSQRGVIPPETFIPVAEESGLILQIDEWVLRTACREAASWSRPLVVAVNISAVQLHSVQFSHKLHEILLQTGLPPRRLELEITETALIHDLDRALSTLRQVKALGVRVAMDDFGTGYSSLANLRAFPFDKIKIDGSFIKLVDRNEQTAAIVRAVLGLGKGLRLPVLAEGIETAGEFRFLASELCGEGQGFYFGRPAPIESFSHLVHGTAEAAPSPTFADLQTKLA
jgi:diguanylate cyclase (GGDEF)-like protein/PAS domain S-box-containing protein